MISEGIILKHSDVAGRSGKLGTCLYMFYRSNHITMNDRANNSWNGCGIN